MLLLCIMYGFVRYHSNDLTSRYVVYFYIVTRQHMRYNELYNSDEYFQILHETSFGSYICTCVYARSVDILNIFFLLNFQVKKKRR